MRVLNRLDISGSFGLGSNVKDQFVIGSPDLENNDISTDNLKVWANADFKNNVTLGSNSTDIIDISGTLINHGGASLTGSFSGSGQNLNNIPNTGLQNYQINLNGSNLALGATGSVGTLREITGGSNITIGLVNASTRSVSLNDNINLSSVTASFSGNGSQINNLTASNINNFSADTRKQISGTGVISYDPVTGIITYTGAGGDIYTSGNITGSGTALNPITMKDAITASVGVSASYYYGDGSNLTGLMTSVFTTGNVDGDGSSGNKIRLKDNISLTSVTASYFTGSSAKLNYLDFVGLSTPPAQDTAIVWQDETSYELRQWTEVPSVHIKLGQQVVTRVHNNTGVTISKGTVVHLTGANNQPVPRINPANWSDDYLSANTLGVTNNDILHGGEGYVVISGLIEGIDTNGFNSGDVLYLSGSGGISNVKAVAPNHLVIVGQVVRNGNSSVGSIFVKVQNGYEIDELHNVLITGSSNYDLLMLDTDGLWKNTKNLSGSYTFSGNNKFTGSLNGTASYASNADLFDGQDSSLFALKTDVTGALNPYLTSANAASTYATLTGVTSSFTTPTQVSGAISGSDRPTRAEVTGALGSYLLSSTAASTYTTPSQVSSSITGAISDRPTRTEVTGVLAGYAKLDAINTFSAASNIFNNDVTINGTASIAMLNTVNQQSLVVGDKYITILSGSSTHVQMDGAGILFGSGSSDPTTGDQSSVAHIVYRKGNAPSDYISDYIEVYPQLRSVGVISGSNLTGSNTGDETSATIKSKLGAASSLQDGYLTSTDWTTFNNKLSSITVGGNITGSGTSGSPYGVNVSPTFTTVTANTGFVGGSFTGTTISGSSTLQAGGQTTLGAGVKLAIVTKTSSYTLIASSDYIIAFNGANLTGTLPNASGIQGSAFIIKNLATSSVFVTSSTANIDGSTSGFTIYNQYSSYTFVSDGTNWLMV